MRNQEAARYARWAAIAAATVALIVIGVFAQRSIWRARAGRHAPPMVSTEVQQQSANFSYSDVEQGRTVFTIRASHATQFKDQNRALLEDVWISIYGHEGDRDDNIHTRECSYQPATGGILCRGEVQIDIRSAGAETRRQDGDGIQLQTSDLAFNRETGEASTDAPVQFKFSQGKGRGVGILYSTKDATVRIGRSVEFNLDASERTGGLPVDVMSDTLEVQRTEHNVVLGGPAIVRQGQRELLAGRISIHLDEQNRAQTLVAEDHPSVRTAEGTTKLNLSARTFEAILSQEGGVRSFVADGSVVGMRQDATGTDRLWGGHLELAMLPQQNSIREMNVSGGVTTQSLQGMASNAVKTDALRVLFHAPMAGGKSGGQLPSQRQDVSILASAGHQRVESIETLAPATIDSRTGNESIELGAKKFVAQFNQGGRIDKLFGHSDVKVRREVPNSAPQVSSSNELTATFGPDGQWSSLDESGNVYFSDGNKQASASRSEMNRLTGVMHLEGSPVLSDSMSRTTAAAFEINQQSGEIHAAGGVVSTYLPSPGGAAPMDFGAGEAHISADGLSGSTTSGNIRYSGHARLWQGESVLGSDQIEIGRDDQKVQAHGNVVAIFPQTSAKGPSFVAAPVPRPKSTANPAAPVLWQIHAPDLTYWGSQARAHLQGGVTASSDEGTLQSRTLDIFLDSATGASGGTYSPATSSTATGAQQLSRVVANGSVIVHQGDRRGTSEQAEYTAADQKFVLSGGQPTVFDAASDTTTVGRSLTFFVASDTILIDSQEGLRTLTKHRVEK